MRYVPGSSLLVPFAAHGLIPSELAALPPSFPIGAFAAFGRALATGRACYVANPAGESVPSDLANEFRLGSFVIVPLFSEGRCLGFMTCDEHGETFSLESAEIDLLTTFGALIAPSWRRQSRTGSSAASTS